MLLLCLALPAQGQDHFRVLHYFGNGHDGAGVWDSVTVDQNKNVYGTTSGGGNYGYGTVWELKWMSTGKWGENILQSFRPLDSRGAEPNGGVLLNMHGNVYGTTSSGGLYGRLGTAFKLSLSRGKWRLEVLHKFGGPHDPTCCPWGNLIMGANGNLYGTGSSAFELSPTANGWTETVLHEFTGNNGDGLLPQAGPIRDVAGNLYGTTLHGGGSKECGDGCGTVWELSPPTSGGDASAQGWTEHILHRFGVDDTLAFPGVGQLTMDQQGNLYGTANGGKYAGVVYKLSRVPTATAENETWRETILYNFTGGWDGGLSEGVILDKAGNLYGSTSVGGKYGEGVIFKLSPQSNGSWRYTLLHTFTGADGAEPANNLTLGPDDILYGTTATGGAYGGGVVFQLAP